MGFGEVGRRGFWKPYFLEKSRHWVSVFDGWSNVFLGKRWIFVDPDMNEYVFVYGHWYVVEEDRLPGRYGICDVVYNVAVWDGDLKDAI